MLLQSNRLKSVVELQLRTKCFQSGFRCLCIQRCSGLTTASTFQVLHDRLSVSAGCNFSVGELLCCFAHKLPQCLLHTCIWNSDLPTERTFAMDGTLHPSAYLWNRICYTAKHAVHILSTHHPGYTDSCNWLGC